MILNSVSLKSRDFGRRVHKIRVILLFMSYRQTALTRCLSINVNWFSLLKWNTAKTTYSQTNWCSYIRGCRMVPRKTWVSESFGRISKSLKRFWWVSKSRFFMVCFSFFESRKFSPKSLGLGFLTRISASRRVSDYHSPPLILNSRDHG